jgi:hypothetical protein
MKYPLIVLAALATLAVADLTRADAPANRQVAAKAQVPAAQAPAHRKQKCCAGRMQAQPKPPEPTK